MARITKMERFETIEAILREAGAVDEANFVADEMIKLAKRNGKDRGLTKTQKENVEFKTQIVGMLNETEGMTATAIAEAMAELTGENFAAQKATALLKQLVDAGEVTRVEGKGKVKTTFVVA